MRFVISKYSFLLVICSFFLMIILGSLFLSIPGALNTKLLFIDTIFIATSTIAGIGACPIPLCNFTTLGKAILIFLMYIGNIGILIILLGIIFYFANYSIEWYGLTTELFTIISIKTISSLFKIIFIGTILFQIIGVSCFYLLSKYLSLNISLIDFLFISINFFCNVGFSIESILPKIFYTNSWYYLISSIMIMIGGFGFLLLFECQEFFRQKFYSKNFSFSFTSKLMIKIYFSTTILFWLFYFLTCESQYSILSFSRSLFSAISIRSCGINPYCEMTPSISFISAIYGLFGAGVLGPCGGIKSSVLGIIIYTFFSLIKKNDSVIIYNKKISWQLVAFSHIFLLYIIGLATIASLIIDLLKYHQIDFILIYSDMLGLIGSGASWSSLISEITIKEKILCILLICITKIAAFSLSLYLTKFKKSELQYPEAKLIII